jgi:hypothetical protein
MMMMGIPFAISHRSCETPRISGDRVFISHHHHYFFVWVVVGNSGRTNRKQSIQQFKKKRMPRFVFRIPESPKSRFMIGKKIWKRPTEAIDPGSRTRVASGQHGL